MKQKYIILGLFALLGASCSNQELEENLLETGKVEVTAGIARSRVSFNQGENVTYAYWQNGDAITLNTPKQGNLNYTASVTESNPTTATFAAQGTALKDIAGETVWAVYPAAEITNGAATLPATEEWRDTQTLPFAYAVSSIKDSKVNLQFKQVFSFLKLTMTADVLSTSTSTDGDKTIHQVVIKSAEGPVAVRTGTFLFENQEISISETAGSIYYTLTEGFQPETETERSVYIPLLPVAADTELSIYLQHRDADGAFSTIYKMTKKTPTDGFVAGHVYTLKLTGEAEEDTPSSGVIEGEEGEIHLSVGGTLSDYITDENKYTIKSLKVSGYLNSDDIRLLREMAGRDKNGSETEGIMTYLDVSEATIVAGGKEAYYGANWTTDNIWGNSFFNSTKLENVLLPQNITAIGYRAFYECTSLKEITVPNTVLTIGNQAFAYCSALKTLTLPEDAALTTIEEYAFYDNALTTVTIPDKVATIGEYAFGSCNSMNTLSIGKGVIEIGERAFYECTTLLKVSFAEDAALTTIGECAFYKCGYLTTVTLPDAVKTIGDSAFSGCEALAKVTLGKNVETIGEQAFYYCSSLAVVSMGNAVTSIGNGAFRGCSALATINLSEALTSLGSEAFAYCTALPNITLPSGLTSIKGSTFYKCSILKSIDIPNAITSIGGSAFYECISMKQATIGQGVTSIGQYAFYNCKTLEAIVIPDAVTSIGEHAFRDCDKLTDVTLGTGLRSIGESTFSGCTSIKSINLPEEIESIGMYAFEGCEALTAATNVIADNPAIFSRCSALTTVTINPKTTKIGNKAFYGCSSLTNVVLPESVLNIESQAFGGCSSMTSINIPENVILIGSYAFSGCSSLAAITIPEGLTKIDEYVFHNCTSLTNVVIPDAITTIGGYAFSGCTSLSKLTLGESLTNIGAYAFNDAPITECLSYPTTPASFSTSHPAFDENSIDATTAKLYVPQGSLAAYQKSDWATYFGIIAEME